jgi:cytosine/adenosine deaminase-related metal-dependent hydrolase
VPASSEVKVFNNEVDALARQFQLLGNSIVEAGAAVDLSIMDAKDSIERLRARLEHAVRIGGKKVHNVFGDEEQGIQPRVDKFFDKTSRKPMGKSIFDAEDDA